MKTKSAAIKLLLILLPFLLGAFGFIVIAGEPVLDSLFACVMMYVLNYGDTPANVWIELARWTAPLATAGGVVLLLSRFQKRILSVLRFYLSDSVAVYGDENETRLILSQLGHRGMDGEKDFIPAKKYLLLNKESDNFAFYSAHSTALSKSQVYLRCESGRGQSSSDANLHLFCSEETAARIFWKQHDIYELFRSNGPHLRIVFIGFGRLGEELLYWGLQNNIFDPKQKIEYHIFGDCSAFTSMHRGLSLISDPVIRHTRPWYEETASLEQADAVIVLKQEEQFQLVRELLSVIPQKTFCVFSAAGSLLKLLDESERLQLFDWNRISLNVDFIMDDVLLERAKRINLRYSHLYSGIPENERTCEEQWKQLNAFTRYSNISSADYHEIRLKMLTHMNLSPTGEGISPRQLELLSELEHIRWCRYHWLNHWQYGIPANGKAKDASLRIHSDLIPYDRLTEEEKEKDRENIRVLLALGENGKL